MLGNRSVTFIKNFEDAIANGKLSDDELDRLRWIQRAACYYWNLAAAENGEGAHNPTYYRHTLEMGNKVLDEGDSILNVPSRTQSSN